MRERETTNPTGADAFCNLLLTRFLIDRTKKENSAKLDAVVTLELCKEMLQDLAHTWNGLLERESQVSAHALYQLYVLMGTIERLMGRLPSEGQDYLRLHKCIVLLDEVELTFEEFAAAKVKTNKTINAAKADLLPLAS
jgi:hypothetical protein